LKNCLAIPPVYIDIWLCHVNNTSKALETNIKPLLSSSEKARLAATKNNNKKREFLISRSVMRHALSQKFELGESEWEFISKPNQPPIVTNLPQNTYLSLSHSNGLICFAISSSPIGLDIEDTLKKRNFSALSNLLMDSEELRFFTDIRDKESENFYRIWCAKEAYYKAISETQQSATPLKKVSVPSLLNDPKQWFLYEASNKQFQLSIFTKHKPTVINQHYYPMRTDETVFNLAITGQLK